MMGCGSGIGLSRFGCRVQGEGTGDMFFGGDARYTFIISRTA